MATKRPKRKLNTLTLAQIQEKAEAVRAGIREVHRIPSKGGPEDGQYFGAVWPSILEPIHFSTIVDGQYELQTDADGVPFYQWVELDES
jgi:hypothetical protein